MQKLRFVRVLVYFVMLSFGGLLLGCGEGAPTELTPDKKEVNKKKAEEFKDAMRQQKAARAGAKGGGR